MPTRFQVSLPIYEGPMELLLELVERQEVDLAQVDVALVCEEFLEYVEQAEQLELDLAGEFLVMAAGLVVLKARLLFPRRNEETDETLSSAADLLENIAEYKRFKELAGTLREFELIQLELFPRGAPAKFDHRRPRLDNSTDLHALVDAFRRLMPVPMSEDFLAQERVSIAERIDEILRLLTEKERISLAELVGDRRQRDSVVVTFLALLELVRLGQVRLAQAGEYLSLWAAGSAVRCTT